MCIAFPGTSEFNSIQIKSNQIKSNQIKSKIAADLLSQESRVEETSRPPRGGRLGKSGWGPPRRGEAGGHNALPLPGGNVDLVA